MQLLPPHLQKWTSWQGPLTWWLLPDQHKVVGFQELLRCHRVLRGGQPWGQDVWESYWHRLAWLLGVCPTWQGDRLSERKFLRDPHRKSTTFWSDWLLSYTVHTTFFRCMEYSTEDIPSFRWMIACGRSKRLVMKMRTYIASRQTQWQSP